MSRLVKLLRDGKGSAAIEFAVAVPALVTFIWGIFQVGVVYQANAGMQHALGEAARYATIFPTPSDTLIEDKITSAKFGLNSGTWDDPEITTDVDARTKTISVSYEQPTNFLLFPGPTVELSAEKVVYLAS